MKKVLISFIFILLLTHCQPETTPEVENYKATWIKAAFKDLEDGIFPRIQAVSWWQESWENEDGSISDLRINSSPEALSAFQEAVKAPVFTSDLNFQDEKLIPKTDQIYFNAFPDFGGPEDLVSEARIDNFEKLTGKSIGWAYFSDNWYYDIQFPDSAMAVIHKAGKTPFVRMMARSILQEGQPDTQYSLQNIIDGQFDTSLQMWFEAAAQVGYPILIEFGTEVNGDWFPWNGTFNGGAQTTDYGDPNLADGPERFRDAYRHIIDLSRQAGAVNLTWFFHLDASGQPQEDWNNFENYYPGDTYIDWVGVSVYGAMTPNDDTESFYDKLQAVYSRMCLMTQKPLAILEFGITEQAKPPAP